MKQLAFVGVALAACGSPPLATRPQSVDGFASPESVVLVGARRFVSNIGSALDPLAKDGDGFISELDRTGQVVRPRAFTGLDAPKGMASLDGVLYVADIDRVVGFDLASGLQVFVASVREVPALLNDLAVQSPRALVVTDTLNGSVQTLDLQTKRFMTIATDISGANGVAVHGATTYVVGLGTALSGGSAPGEIVRISSDGSRTTLGPTGLFDGVAMVDGGLLVSDWVSITSPTAGRIVRVEDAIVTELSMPEAMHGPADFAYDGEQRQLWIPRSLDQRISIVGVPAVRRAQTL